MASLVAMVVSAGMVWTSAASEAELGEVRQEAGKAVGAQEKAGPMGTVKPVCRWILPGGWYKFDGKPRGF